MPDEEDPGSGCPPALGSACGIEIAGGVSCDSVATAEDPVSSSEGIGADPGADPLSSGESASVPAPRLPPGMRHIK